MSVHHEILAAGRWHTFTLAEQLGNAGSEFSRAVSWSKRGDKGKSELAAARFFELMDLTLADPRWQGARRRELARLREQAGEELRLPFPTLERYFDHFAILARSKR